MSDAHTIKVHVFGNGFGESIVIELPGTEEKLGVIDSFTLFDERTGRRDKSFLPRFVSELRPNGAKLEFLAITHPHADHCLGAAELLTDSRISVERLWLFASMNVLTSVDHYYKVLLNSKRLDPVEKDLGLGRGRVYREINALMNFASLPVSERPPYREISSGLPTKLGTAAVQVVFLTPGQRIIQEYHNLLKRSLSGKIAVDHNLVCGAMAVIWGETKLLFLSDVVSKLWDEWYDDCHDSHWQYISEAHFVKLGHHGSTNAYSHRFHKAICCPERPPIMVVTPFARGRSSLPTREGVEALLPHKPLLVCTSRAHAIKATPTQWKWGRAKKAPPLPSPPIAWNYDIYSNPELRGLLSPLCNGPANLPLDARVPASWVRDVLANRTLLHCLHPEITGLPLLVDPEINANRVSFVFDDKGRELADMRYIGPEAGILRRK